MSRHDILGGVALVLWAFLGLLTRLSAGIPPLQLTAMAVGGAAGLAVVLARGQGARLRQGGLAWAHGVGGLAGYHALYFAALALAPPVEANLLNYLWPLLIVLLSAPVLGLALDARRLAGVALGLAGCALLLGGGAGFAPAAWPGFLCAAAAALVWALYSVTARRLAAVPTEAVAGFCLGAAFFLWDAGMKRGDPRLLGTLAYATPVASTALLLAAGEGQAGWRVLAAAGLVAGGGLLAAAGRGVGPAPAAVARP